MNTAIPTSGSAVYIIYRISSDSANRETVGWLTKETGGSICIQNDRTIETSKNASGSGKGTLLKISWIKELYVLEKGEKINPGSLRINSLP